MRIINCNFNLYNKTSQSAQKDKTFQGSNLVTSTLKQASQKSVLSYYIKPSVELKTNVSINFIKNILLKKASETESISQNQKIKDKANDIIHYSNNKNQLSLTNLMLNNNYFHTEKRIKQMMNIILASNSSEKYDFMTRILSNEYFYKNKNILEYLEPILYSMNHKSSSHEPRNIILDKVLYSEKLYENKSFMNNLGKILYETCDFVSSYKTENILEAVLNDESLLNNENFVGAVGEILSLRDIARYANLDLSRIFAPFVNNDREFYLLKAITFILGVEATDIYTDLITRNKKLSNDEKFLVYLPDIIKTINAKNRHKANDIIEYINKNKSKNSEELNKEIISEYMYTNYDSISSAEQVSKFKLKVQEKQKLAKPSERESYYDIMVFLNDKKKEVLSAFELLGEKNLAHTITLKAVEFKELCENCLSIKENTSNEYYEKLLLKFNPQSSKQYKELEAKILKLKKSYPKIKASGDIDELKELEKNINIYTKQARDILSGKLNYDPDTAIERIRILAGIFDEYELDNSKKPYEFIKMLKNSSPENDEEWKDFCYREIFNKMKLDYDKELADKLNLINSKYLGKVVIANEGFLSGLKDIVLLIKNNPQKTIAEILNDLPQNKITQSEFNSYSIDYERWISINENSFIDIVDDYNRSIRIKKVDMNNISKALFLGNEASCCTKVGRGTKQESAPTYIKNKLIGAIEILDTETPIGNTMCYFAEVNDKLAFILDNIEILSGYKNLNLIRDGIFEYAKKVCEEVGKPDIPIYVLGHRNKINLENYTAYYMLNPIGNSGEDKIYFDFLTSFSKVGPNSSFDAELTRVF